MIGIIVSFVVGGIVGFVAGIIIGRKNADKVSTVVSAANSVGGLVNKK